MSSISKRQINKSFLPSRPNSQVLSERVQAVIGGSIDSNGRVTILGQIHAYSQNPGQVNVRGYLYIPKGAYFVSDELTSQGFLAGTAYTIMDTWQ
jgi:hypothetical protein